MRKRMMVYRRLSERLTEQKRAALERDWMTLSEGIHLIERVDAESKEEIKQPPYHQICDAIEDGEVRARWLDETPPPRGPSALWGMPLDKPQNFIGEIRKRKVRFQNGGEIHWGGRHWRKLLLSREDMQRSFGGTDGAPTKELRQLSKNDSGMQTILEAISEVYNLAEAQGVKPPNVRELRELVPQWLAKHRGVTAPGQWIEEAAGDPRYASRRGKPGKTIKGCLRPISQLKI